MNTPELNEKQQKKIFKIIKKLKVKRGVKEVTKAVRKQKGICLIASDVYPIDCISHLPVLCEDNDIKYVFCGGKKELGSILKTKPTSTVFIDNGVEQFQEILSLL
jgi:H/ACA ribonucleoprotein complex subunit 2